MNKTTLKQKFVLVFFGFFLSLLFIEFLLRVFSFVFISLQDYLNINQAKKKGSYRILCLGESTTAFGGNNSYPSILEKILNDKKLKINFTVINKGIPGVSTNEILVNLEENIKIYNPNMILTMIGINDSLFFKRYENISNKNSKLIGFLNNFKFFKFFKFYNFLNPSFIKNKTDFRTKEKQFLNYVIKNGDVTSYVKLAKFYRKNHLFDKAIKAYKRAIIKNPDNINLYIDFGNLLFELRFINEINEIFQNFLIANREKTEAFVGTANFYCSHNMHNNAVNLFNNAIRIDPNNGNNYVGLSKIYFDKGYYKKTLKLLKLALSQNLKKYSIRKELINYYNYVGDYKRNEFIIKEAIKTDPKNGIAYSDLAKCYLKNFKSHKSEFYFLKATKTSPFNSYAFIELGNYYNKKFIHNFKKAQTAYRKAIKLNPNNPMGYKHLAKLYQKYKHYKKCENVLMNTIKKFPENLDSYILLGILYSSKKDFNLAKKFFEKALSINENNKWLKEEITIFSFEAKNKNIVENNYNTHENFPYNPLTIYTYNEIVKIIINKSIKLACVQYPTLSLKPLTKILKHKENLLFIDNEALFKDIVTEKNYSEYFTDRFGGSFGHCTAKGNNLLANNIAEAIIKKYFKN